MVLAHYERTPGRDLVTGESDTVEQVESIAKELTKKGSKLEIQVGPVRKVPGTSAEYVRVQVIKGNKVEMSELYWTDENHIARGEGSEGIVAFDETTFRQQLTEILSSEVRPSRNAN